MAARKVLLEVGNSSGGKIEAGEMTPRSPIRELKEELDVTISIGELCAEITHNYGDVNINLIYYCKIIDGKIHKCQHTICINGADIKHLLEHNLLPADIQVAKKMLENS